MSDALQLARPASLDPVAAPWVDRRAYPFTSHALLLSEGLVHYLDEGSGEAIVFVHGTPTWSFEYRELIRELRASHRCIAFDHLGFGLSERPAGFGYRPEDHARVFNEFVEKLSLERFTLIVHDFGGPIALPFAEAHPERITRLVVLNSFMWPLEDPAFVRQARIAGSALGRLMYRYLNFSLRVLMPSVYGDKRRLTRAVHAQYLAPFKARAARETVLWALARALLGSHAHYSALWANRARLATIPTLVLWGARDRAFTLEFLERWQQALPHAHVEQLDDAGHWPHEERPELVLQALQRFLEQHDTEA
ncbi:MAG TPA: alpha/beta fold hydrolase [Polyangiaceae bacterium]|nr:alpha/beta fold hydrolase [Polyangiaceae bacterium]